MIDLYGVLQEQETVNGELGLGVDYYKGEQGEQGIPGKDGKDGSDQVYVGADEPTDERVKLWIDTDATPPSKTVSWDEIENKPEIPAPYTLPTASTSTLGGVKVDGNTITITDGVISAKGGSGGAEPDAYIKDASVSGNTLTLTKKDDTNVVFTPSGGSGGGVSGYHFEVDTTLTDEDKTHIIEIWNNKNIPMFIGNKTVIRKFAVGATKYFCVINLNNTENKVLVYTIQTDALNTSVLSDKFTLVLSYDLVSNTDGGYILTSNNWQNYINVGGGDWNYTSYSDGSLYDAKELVIFYKLSGGQYSWKYINCSVDQDGNTGMTLGTGNLMNQMFSLESDNYYCWFNGSSFQFNGSGTCLGVLYKT